MKRVLTMLVAVACSGCAIVAGPNNTLRPLNTEITKTPPPNDKKRWIDFTTIEDAQTKLRRATDEYRTYATDYRKLAGDTLDDFSVASLLGGSIAGATGHVEGARWGAGLAALLGFGVDRYQFSIQYANMVQAAEAFECLVDAIDDLTTADLNRPVLPGDAEDSKLGELNVIRRDLRRRVQRAATSVENTYAAAQAEIKLAQPNMGAFEDAIKKRPKPEETAAIQIARRSGRQGEFTPQGDKVENVFDAIRLHRLNIQELEVALASARVEYAKKERELRLAKLTEEEREKQLGELKKALVNPAEEALKKEKENLRDTIEKKLLDQNDDVDRHLYVVQRLMTVDADIAKCKAQMGAK